MFEHADAYCGSCDKTMHIRWEADNPKPRLRAYAAAAEAHRRESPDCKTPELTITPYRADFSWAAPAQPYGTDPVNLQPFTK